MNDIPWNNEDFPYKCGFVTLIGRPNTGKSTLLNALLGQKVAAVSPRPQTTQRRQLGILTLEDAQIIFMDTPGIHNPHHKLGEYMNEVAKATLEQADVLIWMVDLSVSPHQEDLLIADFLKEIEHLPPAILALNKVDLLSPNQTQNRQDSYQDLIPQADPVLLSATSGAGQQQLLSEIIDRLPSSPPLYSAEQITDFYEREIAADLIREAALLHLRDEIPHAIAVRIDEYKERGESGNYIAATLFVERESHKGIVIGQKGSMIKTIGSTARQEIEAMSGQKTYLELRVKIKKNWRNNSSVLRYFGFVENK